MSTKHRWLRYLVPISGYLLVVFTHAQQDYIIGKSLNVVGVLIGSTLIQSLVGLPDLTAIDGTPWQYVALLFGATVGLVGINLINIPLLFWSLWQSGEAERQGIRHQLATEPEFVITPAEYAGVVAERRFQLRSLPDYPKSISRAIVQRQNELAFRKAFVQRPGGDVERDRPVVVLRDAIAQLRRASPANNASQESLL